MVRGGPAPNTYKLPNTVGFRYHDPTKLKGPVYTLRHKHGEYERLGLGPGFYNLTNKTRFGPSQAPAYTMGAKLPDIYNNRAPAPIQYYPEKYPHQKQNPPKFTIAKKTQSLMYHKGPAPDTYQLPSTLGSKKPGKCNVAGYTIGMKIKTPRGEGVPAPNKYGPVNPSSYRPSSAKYTMRRKTALAVDKTQKPAPNTYFPKLRIRENSSTFSFGRKDVDGRVTYYTDDDIAQCHTIDGIKQGC